MQAPRMSFPGLSIATEFPEEEGPSDATMVAHVPEELLAAASGQSESAKQEAAEERHFREIFDQFFATKKQQGESVEGLTYPKFAQTLRKNKDQIVSRHGVREVRFSVYVKDGKAAIKATPVRG